LSRLRWTRRQSCRLLLSRLTPLFRRLLRLLRQRLRPLRRRRLYGQQSSRRRSCHR